MRFEEKLIKLRKENAMSQEELGEKLDVTRQTISKWELGQSKPDMDKLMQISELFNVSLEDLTKEDNDVSNSIKNNEVNKETEITEVKPRKWLLVLLIIIALAIIVVLVSKVISDRKEAKENGNEAVKGIFSLFDRVNERFENDDFTSTSNYVNEMQSQIRNTISVDSFNNKFKMYTSANWGSSIEMLIDKVIDSNRTNNEKIIEVCFNNQCTTDINTISSFKDSLDKWDKYDVNLDYDVEGYVNKITIVLNKKEFNKKFEDYVGTDSGIFKKDALDKVQENNRLDNGHKITVIFNGRSTTDVNQIIDMRDSISYNSKYKVSVNYGNDGYVNQLVVNKV